MLYEDGSLYILHVIEVWTYSFSYTKVIFTVQGCISFMQIPIFYRVCN